MNIYPVKFSVMFHLWFLCHLLISNTTEPPFKGFPNKKYPIALEALGEQGSRGVKVGC
jgi:hypothetical protein